MLLRFSIFCFFFVLLIFNLFSHANIYDCLLTEPARVRHGGVHGRVRRGPHEGVPGQETPSGFEFQGLHGHVRRYGDAGHFRDDQRSVGGERCLEQEGGLAESPNVFDRDGLIGVPVYLDPLLCAVAYELVRFQCCQC